MWEIMTQEESRGRAKFPVQCKAVKFRPQDTATGMQFIPLGFHLLQVIVENKHGDMLRFKISFAKGLNNPSFAVQHPDKMDHPLVTYGTGKSRRTVYDLLAPKKRIPGEKERYDTHAEFERRVRQAVGAALCEKIMALFVKKIQSTVGIEVDAEEAEAA